MRKPISPEKRLEFQERALANAAKVVETVPGFTEDGYGKVNISKEAIERSEKELQDDRDEKHLKQVHSNAHVLERQERIILSEMLHGEEDRTTKWADFRIQLGLAPGEEIPEFLWTCDDSKMVAREIDRIYRGQITNVRQISRKALIASYAARAENEQVTGSAVGFNMAVNEYGQYIPGETGSIAQYRIAVEIFKEENARRQSLKAVETYEWQIRADRPIHEVIFELQQKLGQAQAIVKGRIRTDDGAIELKDSFDYLLEKRQKKERITIIPTGIRALDIDLEGGLCPEDPGNIYIMGARTGVGKTTLGIATTAGLYMNGGTIMFLNLEMKKDDILARLQARIGYDNGLQVPSWYLKNKGQYPESDEKEKDILELKNIIASGKYPGKIFVKGERGASIDSVIDSIYETKNKHPELNAVFIDHFHIIGLPKGYGQRSEKMESMANALLHAATTCGVDIFILAQLNRNAELAKKPELGHINGTDVLGQVATCAWFLDQDRSNENPVQGSTHFMTLHHGKVRHGQKEVTGFSKGNYIQEPETNVTVDRVYSVFTDGKTYETSR